MKLLKSLLVVLVLVMSVCGSASAWELVYQHDADGNPLSGSMSNLAAAIKAGADVKLVVDNGYSTQIIPGILNVYNNDTAAYAQSTFMSPNADGTLFNNDWRETDIFRTDGLRLVVVHSVSTGAVAVTFSEYHGLKWFVNR